MKIHLLLILVLSGYSAAEEKMALPSAEEVDREARTIFTTVMSPYCPGALLADCTSGAARAMRDTIRAQLRRGRPSKEIVDELVLDYGRQILGLPPMTGAGGLAWLLPIFAFAVGLWGIYRWLGRRVCPRPQPTSNLVKEDPVLKKRMREELQQYE